MIMFSVLTVISVVGFLFTFIPSFTFTPETYQSFLDIGFSVIDGVLYFFPRSTVLSIFLILISIHTFRIVVILVKTIWDVLPIV